MKTIICILLLSGFTSSVYSQKTKPVTRTTTQKKALPAKTAGTVKSTISSTPPLQPGETATDRYLNGAPRKGTSATTTQSATGASANATPFAGGVHPAENAEKTFDTLNPNTAANPNAVGNQNTITNNINRNTTSTANTRGTDTVYNANTVNNGINNGGVTTNSGAVDRSGQTQFGQTNWGSSRSTVGESQWTVPPPISASFSKEFPAAGNASWSRNNRDTSLFSAHYKSGESWVTANYNAAGTRMDLRTEVPMVQPPRPVSVYLAKQPNTFHAVTINKLQVQGKADVYEIQTQDGKMIYLNNDGAEVQP